MRKSLSIFPLLTAFLFHAFFFASGLRAGAADGTLDVYWVDVEGGGATLIVTPAGESVLIDSGYPGERDAKRIFEVATREAGVKQIDHLVTTHYHLDHFGGAATLATLMPIRNVYDNRLFKEGWEKPSKEYLEFKAEKRVVLSAGDEIPLRQPDRASAQGQGPDPAFAQGQEPERSFARGREPDRAGPIGTQSRTLSRTSSEAPKSSDLRSDRTDTVRLPPSRAGQVLSLRCVMARQTPLPAPPDAVANDDCAGARRQRPDYGDNANSINLLLTFGDFRFFDGGDTSWNVELKLVCPVKLVPPVDVYQVNHHGQASSNNPLLIAALSPTVAVMNNGPRKGGQPLAFATLKAQPSIQALYAMHKNVKPGEEDANTADELIANVDEACQGNYIKMSVAPDGERYTIAIPAKGYTRTFSTNHPAASRGVGK